MPVIGGEREAAVVLRSTSRLAELNRLRIETLLRRVKALEERVERLEAEVERLRSRCGSGGSG